MAKQLAKPAVALLLAMGVVGYMLTKGTPEALASELLVRAVSQQSSSRHQAKGLRLHGGGGECHVSSGGDFTLVSEPRHRGYCDSLVVTLRAAGWAEDDLLTAKKFQTWRASLSRKVDVVAEGKDTTEITTTTEASPFRLAMLRVQTSDYQPVGAHYEFVSEDEQ